MFEGSCSSLMFEKQKLLGWGPNGQKGSELYYKDDKIYNGLEAGWGPLDGPGLQTNRYYENGELRKIQYMNKEGKLTSEAGYENFRKLYETIYRQERGPLTRYWNRKGEMVNSLEEAKK